MGRWVNEDRWSNLIESTANTYGVPGNLIQAIIATESQFAPNAQRGEAGGDQSVGLMQILLSTARGEGYSGSAGDPRLLSGLFDPATNINFGTSYLSDMYGRAGGDIQRTASAYNGGWRPEIGFGAKATRAMTICLVRDTKGNCLRTRAVKVGEFSNQPYVDAVIANYQYFQGKLSTVPGVTTPPLTPANQQHEPEVDWRISGAPPWTLGAAIQKAIKEILQWFRG